ncbi:alpha/beta fold hydrolase [Streptomyces californicus]|uniref:alpha/beta fold hydrolase n=1 Tax=Streptomyces californicus TaxID=67351 RepID=UPI0037A5528B
MPTFPAPDGTRLAYRCEGTGEPVLCLPGGAGGADYLDDLGGLPTHRRLVFLDPRGTGRSARPERAESYRCDRQVEDVEALRAHLGRARVDILAHSGGANLALRYVARHPRRVGKLVLVGPGVRAVGIAIGGETRRALALRRSGEPWFPDAFAALEAIIEGRGDDWGAVEPFFHGRWDAPARRRRAAARPDNAEAAAGFAADGAFDPPATRTALAGFRGSALLLTGELDMNSPPSSVAACAELFPRATFLEQPGAGHYPWADDPALFAAATVSFLV